MTLKKIVSIDLGFDCSSETERPWDIADDAVDRISNFVSAEGGEAFERFNSKDSSLYVNIQIPVSDIAQANSIEVRLDNNLPNFPPLLGNLRKFNYVSEEIGDESQG